MILTPTDDGVLLKVRIAPKASANRIGQPYGDALKVSVTAAPEKGKANAALVKLLAKTLGIAKSDIEVIAGQTDRNKTLKLRGLSAAEAEAKLLT